MLSRALLSTTRRLQYNLSTPFAIHVANSTSNYSSHLRCGLAAAAALAAITTTTLTFHQNRAQADAAVASTTQTEPSPPSSSKSAPFSPPNKPQNVPSPDSQDLINWSGTHAVSTDRFYQPDTLEELKAIVRHAHNTSQKLRPVGSALSPNGLPFSHAGMVSMANLDKVISVDTKTNRITVQAGARVNQVVEALRPYGLTLQNFASITEQQIGGFTQVSAHGTGVKIPPVDEQVVSLRIITPAAGELVLSATDDDPSLFQVARTSLGMIGVVAELTLQCVPAQKLIEHTFMLSRSEIRKHHRSLLRENKHLRYMWIPYTDDIVVVTCNPVKPGNDEVEQGSAIPMEQRLEPARALLKSHPKNTLSHDRINELKFTSLRDELLALGPLDVTWLKKVNQMESNFWRMSQGTRIDWPDKILQFDCGGQQWVSEVAFPVPNVKENDGQEEKLVDVEFMENIMQMIDKEHIPAHTPIEQRWSAPSLSPMSPAGERPEKELAEFYSWVGIIMYLPDEEVNAEQRQQITDSFKSYRSKCEQKFWSKYNAVEHWGKIELPKTETEKTLLQQRTARKYPTEAFKAICAIFDPQGILRNELTETIFGPEPFP